MFVVGEGCIQSISRSWMFQHNVLSVMPYHLAGPPGNSLNTQHLGQYQQYGGVSHPRVQRSREQQSFFVDLIYLYRHRCNNVCGG